MEKMFHGAVSFNVDISGWDVSEVKYMNSMFDTATSFNIGLSTWDVSKVKQMDFIFYEASNFNQSLCAWNLTSLSQYSNSDMFKETSCPYPAEVFSDYMCFEC